MQGIGQHVTIPRLADVERQQGLREEWRIWQRHHRHFARQLHGYNVGGLATESSSLPKSRPACIFVCAMNNRIGLIILILLCLGLAAAMIMVKKHAADQHLQDTAQIETVSNNLNK